VTCARTRSRSCATCSSRPSTGSRAAGFHRSSCSSALLRSRSSHKGWGRPGDTALVAEEGGSRLGLVWYSFFTEDEHGEGYIDEETPEVAVAVVDGHRGEGIGTALMEAIHARARVDGVGRVSLSVDHDNPARHLYERLGYVALATDEDDERMVLELA
jgi:GNAT superfamily N-acetyltransferase